MYKAAAIDADGDVWGQKADGIWVCQSVDCVAGDTQDLASRFGPIAVTQLIPVEE